MMQHVQIHKKKLNKLKKKNFKFIILITNSK
jgi:hypothetical protein